MRLRSRLRFLRLDFLSEKSAACPPWPVIRGCKFSSPGVTDPGYNIGNIEPRTLPVYLSFRAESRNLSLLNSKSSKRCLDSARHDRATGLGFQQIWAFVRKQEPTGRFSW